MYKHSRIKSCRENHRSRSVKFFDIKMSRLGKRSVSIRLVFLKFPLLSDECISRARPTVNRVREVETQGLIWIGDGRIVRSIATRKCAESLLAASRDRLLINVSPVRIHFDTYFGRYKDLLQRSAKSIPISSFSSSFFAFQATSIHCGLHRRQIEFYRLQAALITVFSVILPDILPGISPKRFRYIMLIADHYLN